ncbi:MAG: DUF6259 domain-containing protein [Angelakisella sp.]
MKLQNDLLLLCFDEQTNNLSELVNRTTGDNYIKLPQNNPIFSLYLLDEQGNRLLCVPEAGQVTQEQQQTVIRYPWLVIGERRVNVSCALSFRLERDEVILTLEVTNREQGVEVIETLCPSIRGISLGATHTDNVILYPHHAGERTVNPVEQYATERYLGFWRGQSVLSEGVYTREMNYCGLASMSWMYYQNSESGLYFGSHDPGFPVTGIIAETGGPQNPWIGLGFRKHHRVRCGESYLGGSYHLGVYCQGWHRGAERYRSYIAPHLEFDNNPAFLKEEYALNQCYNFKKDGALVNRFENIPAMFERGMELGVRHMFIASWNRKGFDCNYPEYYPDMELGSAMDICRGLDYVKSRGGFTTFYINARLFDLESDFYPTVGEKMAIKDYKGNVITESYGPVEFSLSCPSDERWQKQLVDTAVFAMKAYGLKGIYLDQLASAEPFACYAAGHSHSDNGDFNNGYRKILQELKSELKRIDRDAYIMTENCGDIYGSYIWGNLTWNGTHYDEYFNLFRYTFPEYVQVNMVNPRSWVKDTVEQLDWYYKDMQRAALLGSVMWMGLTTRIDGSNMEVEQCARETLQFRKRTNSLINQLRYADDRYMTGVAAGLEVSVWEDDSRLMLLVGTPVRSGGQITLELPCAASLLERYNEQMDESGIQVKIHGSTVTVTVSQGRLFAIVLQKER